MVLSLKDKIEPMKQLVAIGVPIEIPIEIIGQNEHQRTIIKQQAVKKKQVRQKTNLWFILVSVLFSLLFMMPKASAEIVALNGVVTDGEFLSPSFVANPNVPGGGNIQLVDQLRLTDSPFTLTFEVNSGILDEPLSNGYSFLIQDPQGNVTGSNLSLSGTLGNIGLDGFVFESMLRSAGQRIAFDNGALAIDVFIEGSNVNSSNRFLGSSVSRLLSLMSAPVPNTVQTVGDLVQFIQTTQSFTSGTFPIDFFVAVGSGGQMMATSDIAFSVNADADVPPVPLPGAVWLFISGLLGLGVMKRKSVSV